MVKEKRLSPKELMEKLSELTQQVSSVAPKEGKRLKQIERWAKRKTQGELTAKEDVIDFLLQIVTDVEVWYKMKSTVTENSEVTVTAEDPEEIAEQKLPALRYWYSLFSQWLVKYDYKFAIWKKKVLMSGKYREEDKELIEAIINKIKGSEGDAVWRFIADLSMATDIIVSSVEENPLCAQLTTVAKKYSQKKEEKWAETLRHWKIDRGLFISYNPAIADYVDKIVEILRYKSDNLKEGEYRKVNLDKNCTFFESENQDE